MNTKDIARIRLFSQQVAASKFTSVKDLVGWMGAIQAQDFAMAKWAIGVRLTNSTDKLVSAAIDKGEIIRTHLMRPTWHFVSAEDIYWMMELTARKIKSSLNSRHRDLELNEQIFRKTNAILEKSLRGGTHLTRDELIARFEKTGVATGNNRASHIFFQAELKGLICSGSSKNGKPTYALLEERVPKPNSLTRDEALERIAKKYFSSHCPATLNDFIWWSGLSITEAKRAIEFVKADFIFEIIDSQVYLLPNNFSIPRKVSKLVYLLPAYDEFIISYKDRSASLIFEDHIKTVSNNGVFRPVIVADGKIIGTWSRTIKKDTVRIEFKYFREPEEKIIKAIKKRSTQFGNFLKKEVIIL